MYGLMVDGFRWYRFHSKDLAEQEARRQLSWSSVLAAWVEEIGPLDTKWDRVTIVDEPENEEE